MKYKHTSQLDIVIKMLFAIDLNYSDKAGGHSLLLS